MPGPKPIEIKLSAEEKNVLQQMVNRHKTGQQLVKRGRIVLMADDGKSNSHIKRALQVSLNTVRLWRERWSLFRDIPLSELTVEERLEDAPRPGVPARITTEQRCQIEKLACEVPEESGVPISHWSNRDIALEIEKRGIVDRISPRHAGRLLKRSGYKATPDSVLANTGR